MVQSSGGRFIALVVVLLAVSTTPSHIARVTATAVAPYCQYGGWDLTSLSTEEMHFFDGDYNYLLRVCGTVQSQSDCEGAGASLCQLDQSQPPTYRHKLAVWDNSATWSACTDTVNCPNGGELVYYANGDTCTTQQPRTVQFEFICTPGQVTPQIKRLLSQNCNYVVVVGAESICYNPASSSSHPFVSSSGVGTGTGGGDDGSNAGNGSPQGGIIAGVVIAGVVAVTVIIAVAVYWDRTRGRTRGRLPGQQITDFAGDQTHVVKGPPQPYVPPTDATNSRSAVATDRQSLLKSSNGTVYGDAPSGGNGNGNGNLVGGPGGANSNRTPPVIEASSAAVFIGEEKPGLGDQA